MLRMGRVALPLYFYLKDTTGEYPKKVLIVSCDDWNIRDEVEIHCPDVIRKGEICNYWVVSTCFPTVTG